MPICANRATWPSDSAMYLYFTQVDPVPPGVNQALTEKGWQVEHLPLRKVVWAPAELNWTNFDLVIVSSKQAALWLRAHPPTSWPDLAVVGESSSALLPRQHLLFATAPANAAELVERLLPRLAPRTRILFLRGEMAQDTIPLALAAHDFHQTIVYRTEKNLEITSPPPSLAMVYFQAPGTVADFLEAFRQPPAFVGAIGPTTARALNAVGWRIDFQPSRPENACFARELPPPSAMSIVGGL